MFFILHIGRLWLVKCLSGVKVTLKSEEKSVLHVAYFTIFKQIVPKQTKAHFQIFSKISYIIWQHFIAFVIIHFPELFNSDTKNKETFEQNV